MTGRLLIIKFETEHPHKWYEHDILARWTMENGVKQINTQADPGSSLVFSILMVHPHFPPHCHWWTHDHQLYELNVNVDFGPSERLH